MTINCGICGRFAGNDAVRHIVHYEDGGIVTSIDDWHKCKKCEESKRQGGLKFISFEEIIEKNKKAAENDNR